MICNTTIGTPGTTLSRAIPMSAAAGQGAGARHTVEFARVRRTDDWAALFGITVPTSTALHVAKQPQTYVPQPPRERSP